MPSLAVRYGLSTAEELLGIAVDVVTDEGAPLVLSTTGVCQLMVDTRNSRP